jgi:hypothetical protein
VGHCVASGELYSSSLPGVSRANDSVASGQKCGAFDKLVRSGGAIMGKTLFLAAIFTLLCTAALRLAHQGLEPTKPGTSDEPAAPVPQRTAAPGAGSSAPRMPGDHAPMKAPPTDDPQFSVRPLSVLMGEQDPAATRPNTPDEPAAPVRQYTAAPGADSSAPTVAGSHTSTKAPPTDDLPTTTPPMAETPWPTDDRLPATQPMVEETSSGR